MKYQVVLKSQWGWRVIAATNDLDLAIAIADKHGAAIRSTENGECIER